MVQVRKQTSATSGTKETGNQVASVIFRYLVATPKFTQDDNLGHIYLNHHFSNVSYSRRSDLKIFGDPKYLFCSYLLLNSNT